VCREKRSVKKVCVSVGGNAIPEGRRGNDRKNPAAMRPAQLPEKRIQGMPVCFEVENTKLTSLWIGVSFNLGVKNSPAGGEA